MSRSAPGRARSHAPAGPFADLASLNLLDVPIVGSELLVAEVLEVEERYVPFSLSAASGGLVALEFEIGADTDVLVAPGQGVQKGDMLATNSSASTRPRWNARSSRSSSLPRDWSSPSGSFAAGTLRSKSSTSSASLDSRHGWPASAPRRSCARR